MRIALIVDNPYRDLPGIVLLANQLCQSGATVYLVPLNLASLELSALAPDFVLLTSLRKPRQRFAAQLLEAGVKLGVLDSEGGVLPSLEMYSRLTTPDFSLYRQISCFCSWGPKIANYVKDEGWYGEEQIAVTGAPRFDFYAKQWESAALNLTPSLNEFRRPIILVNGSFPRANPAVLTPEKELESWMALGFDFDYVNRHQEIEHQTMLGMAQLTNQIARKFQNATVVYRPHPFEKLSTYHDLLDTRDNLILAKIGSVEGWIMRASAVVQHHCTTAIEAGMAKKPSLLPNWLPTAQRIDSTEVVSVKCDSQEDLEHKLGQILAGEQDIVNSVRNEVDKVINDWFLEIDGVAHQRAAASILASLNKRDKSINLSECRKIHYDRNRPGVSFSGKISNGLRQGLGLPVSWSHTQFRDVKDYHKNWDSSVKHFDVSRVSVLLDAIGPSAKRVKASLASEKRSYHLNYTAGRAVVLTAAN